MADQASEGLLSPFLRRRRFNVSKPYILGDVLDVGCGTGSLGELVSGSRYCGVEVDALSLAKARIEYPEGEFMERLPKESEKFDTVVSLAVIEHVDNPAGFLSDLSKRLKRTSTARILITTPHPSMDWIHDLGASVGLFSQHANDEHEELLDRESLEAAASGSGLRLVHYKRFLLGANQLAVFEHEDYH